MAFSLREEMESDLGLRALLLKKHEQESGMCSLTPKFYSSERVNIYLQQAIF